MSRKIDVRELLAALGGVLVLISLFLDWFERDRGFGAIGGTGITGWQAFEALDLLLAALAIAAIATGAASLGTAMSFGPRALLPLGAALFVIVGVQLISPPPIAWGDDLATGAWLALGGSLLVLIGGLLRAARIDVTVNVGERDTRPRVAAVDRRPSASGSGGAAGSAAAGSPTAAASKPADDEPPASPAPRRSRLDEPDLDPDATQPFKPVDDA